jgi:hypothetical protein
MDSRWERSTSASFFSYHKELAMLWTIFGILLILWMGLVSSYALGGYTHVLLAISAVVVIAPFWGYRQD